MEDERNYVEQPHGGSLAHFKPGTSGNYNGRPKGSLNLKTLLKIALERDVERISALSLSPKQQRIMDHLVEGHIAKALGTPGDPTTIDTKALDMIYDRLEGKPKQTVEQTEKPWEQLLKEIEEEDKQGA